MYGYVKLLLVTAVGVALVGVAVHEVWSGTLAGVMMSSSQGVRAAVFALQDHILPRTVHKQPPDTINTAKKEKIFTAEELKKYDGRDGNKGPYLAILGLVYNVKKGKKYYGAGGGYEFFSGRDGSRAFVTGDFTEEGLIDDISGLTSSDYIGLDEWMKFYESDYKYVGTDDLWTCRFMNLFLEAFMYRHVKQPTRMRGDDVPSVLDLIFTRKEEEMFDIQYLPPIGKVIGRFYNEKGEPTSYYYDSLRWISQAYNDKENENQEKKMFPPCNSEWAPESGTRVWCTTRSGGVERDWVGLPRKLYNPGHNKPRCACVKNFGPPSHDPTRMPHDNKGDLDHPNLEEYPGCISDQPTCTFKDD